MWNLSKPAEEMSETVQNITLRGNAPDTFLTGEFARKIAAKLEIDNEKANGTISRAKYKTEVQKTGAIDPLSVGSIADVYCHTRRDLYLAKGINRPKAKDCRTWGRTAGLLAEKYLSATFAEQSNFEDFTPLIERCKGIKNAFVDSEKKSIAALSRAEGKDADAKIGDTDWFLRLLDYNGRAEIALKILNSSLKEEESLDVGHVRRDPISPNPAEIGISSPATPDFTIPDSKIVGDIKTGVNFMPNHQLTCAGYALAFENQNKGAKIDWGIVYFFPTRNPSAYVKPITFAQVYIFPIDDQLRNWFLHSRNDAYKIVSSQTIPQFPERPRRTHCPSCKFNKYCTENGLEGN